MSSIKFDENNPYVDEIRTDEKTFENPSPEILINLMNRLRETPFSFDLLRDKAVGGMECKFEDGLFAICGQEEARSFTFCLLDESKTSELIPMDLDEIPLYSTTNSVDVVITAATTYFVSGELDPKIVWHVPKYGIWGPLERIPNSEKYGGKYGGSTLQEYLDRLHNR